MSESWLVLETSGRVARVGLARGGAVVRAVELSDTRRHARDLAPTVKAILDAESLAPTGLTGIMASRGPGSYTGLRVGLMSAKALAYAVGCKLVAVDTFAGIAEQAPADAENVWVIGDALQNQVYIQRFDRSEGARVPFQDLHILGVDEALHWLPAGVWVTGPGVNVYADHIPQTCRL